MASLIIDPTKCNRDGICSDECPLKIIVINRETGLPEIKPGAENACFACGHCVAACPKGALDCSESPLDQAIPIRNEWAVNTDQAVQFLRSRRSGRKYSQKEVEREKILELIEIAGWAPSASNSRRVEWIVFTKQDQIHELVRLTVEWMRGLVIQGPSAVYSPYIVPAVEAWDCGEDRILRGAPVLVFAMAPAISVYGMIDVTIALTYLDLLAPKFGLISCWAGVLHRAMGKYGPLREFVGIPDSHPHYYPMMVGYPKHAYHRIPIRKPANVIWK